VTQTGSRPRETQGAQPVLAQPGSPAHHTIPERERKKETESKAGVLKKLSLAG
jgi:hypothetical protein